MATASWRSQRLYLQGVPSPTPCVRGAVGKSEVYCETAHPQSLCSLALESSFARIPKKVSETLRSGGLRWVQLTFEAGT